MIMSMESEGEWNSDQRIAKSEEELQIRGDVPVLRKRGYPVSVVKAGHHRAQ